MYDVSGTGNGATNIPTWARRGKACVLTRACSNGLPHQFSTLPFEFLVGCQPLIDLGVVMPVFRKNGKKVLFVHVPKAGGSSIEHFLQINGWKMSFYDNGTSEYSVNHFTKCSPQHMHGELLESNFNLARFDYIFMTVRDPLDRAFSEYRYRKKYLGVTADMEQWFSVSLDKYKNNQFIHDNHIRPQSDFLLREASVFKLEGGFDRVIRDVEQKLEIKFTSTIIPRMMRSDDINDVSIAISKELMKTLKQFYSLDYIKFNYVD
ncbi:MAG: sulfotransferase family protein [Planctomycetes bacterium]|nr:sulfotransferase family protein [Planctomycetota bacterium]